MVGPRGRRRPGMAGGLAELEYSCLLPRVHVRWPFCTAATALRIMLRRSPALPARSVVLGRVRARLLRGASQLPCATPLRSRSPRGELLASCRRFGPCCPGSSTGLLLYLEPPVFPRSVTVSSPRNPRELAVLVPSAAFARWRTPPPPITDAPTASAFPASRSTVRHREAPLLGQEPVRQSRGRT